MYVIVKKDGDELYVLAEVYFGSDLCPDMPEVIVKTQWTSVDPSDIDAPYMADLMFFQNKTDAFALLVSMTLFGEEILLYDVVPVLGWCIAPIEEVPGDA